MLKLKDKDGSFSLIRIVVMAFPCVIFVVWMFYLIKQEIRKGGWTQSGYKVGGYVKDGLD